MEDKKTSTPAERITEALRLRGMRASELSKLTGISKSSISSWINGRYEPKQEALYSMGKVLDVAEMWLAGYDLPMERPAFQKKNDALADIILRMRRDEDFFDFVKYISDLSAADFEKVKNVLHAFFK